jgi:Putative 2OG-Fe(II) oxygenase
MNSAQLASKLETAVTTEVLWATPTVTLSLKDSADFNKRLAEIVLAEEQSILAKTKATRVAGIDDGLTAHWLEYNVLNWPYPEIKMFRECVLEGIHQFLALIGDPNDPGMTIQGISCWANVLRPGQFLGIHHHDPAFVSAHYTVQTGFEDCEPKFEGSGNTVYFRPGFVDRSHGGEASGPTSPWDEDWQISRPARSGRLLFFPSYVRHEVRPYFGSTERISIAMDVFLKRQNLPIYFGGPRWYVPK